MSIHTIEDEPAFDREKLEKQMKNAELLKRIAIDFHQYILNQGALKTFQGTYSINDVGVFTPEELYDKFIQENYTKYL